MLANNHNQQSPVGWDVVDRFVLCPSVSADLDCHPSRRLLVAPEFRLRWNSGAFAGLALVDRKLRTPEDMPPDWSCKLRQ